MLASQQAELSIQGEAVMHQTMDPKDLKEVVKTTKKEKIDSFLSKVIHGQMKNMLLGNNMHVMTQSVKVQNGVLGCRMECHLCRV